MHIDKDYKLKIFKDDEELGDVLDLGIVNAGETEQFIYKLVNEERAYLEKIKVKIDHPEVEVIEAPEELKPFSEGRLVLEWAASVTLKEGLKVPIFITGLAQYPPPLR